MTRKQLTVPFKAVGPFERHQNGAGLVEKGTREVFRNPRMVVRHGSAVLSSGVEVDDFTSFERGSAVTVILYCRRTERVVLTRKIKTAAGHAFYQFPAGGLTLGQDPVTQAIAECWEEANLRVTREQLVSLDSIGIRPENARDEEHLFFAEVDDLTNVHANDQKEGLVTEGVPLLQIFILAMTQHFEATSAAALWRAMPHIAKSTGSLAAYVRLAATMGADRVLNH